MKINIIAVGKIKEQFFRDALAEYAKRTSRYAEFKVIELPDAAQGKSPDEQRAIESAQLLDKAKGYIIALDGSGKQLSSEELAQLISTKCTGGISEFSFLIGGSHGHSQQLRDRADMVLSFGKPTFPHQLFRVMLAEQLYRAMTIIAGTPYNK